MRCFAPAHAGADPDHIIDGRACGTGCAGRGATDVAARLRRNFFCCRVALRRFAIFGRFACGGACIIEIGLLPASCEQHQSDSSVGQQDILAHRLPPSRLCWMKSQFVTQINLPTPSSPNYSFTTPFEFSALAARWSQPSWHSAASALLQAGTKRAKQRRKQGMKRIAGE